MNRHMPKNTIAANELNKSLKTRRSVEHSGLFSEEVNPTTEFYGPPNKARLAQTIQNKRNCLNLASFLLFAFIRPDRRSSLAAGQPKRTILQRRGNSHLQTIPKPMCRFAADALTRARRR
jgi:hypothetical protein